MIVYLSLPVILPGDEKNPQKEVKGKVLPGNVIFYHESYSGGGLFIYLSNGSAFETSWPEKTYEEAVGKYWIALAEMAKKQRNIISLHGSGPGR
jgi:hypothetical protein